MNAINHAITAVFDVLLKPLELLGRPTALVLGSAVFGVVALLVFKRVSWQKGIKATKDKIKAHLIEIRIYQDDLVVASKAIGKVFARNFQYLALNLMPFIPLALPFSFVVAQFVVRYGFAPTPVHAQGVELLAGQATLVEVELEHSRTELVRGLTITYPDGIEPVSPLVRNASQGRAFQEIVARRPGVYEIGFALPDGSRESKALAAGVATRTSQPERGKGFFHALLWPAEDGFASDSPFVRIATTCPDSDLGWLPGGTGGVLLVFLIASMAAGAIAMKPLGVQI